jgi:heparosan-N-sulfate-glucuronate 5-epimerase
MKPKLKPSFTDKIKYKLYPYFSANWSYQANFRVKKNVLDPDYWIVGMEHIVKISKLRVDALHTYGPTIKITGLVEYGLGLHDLNRDNDQDTIVRYILAHLQNAVDSDTDIEYSYWRTFIRPPKQDYFVTGMGQGLLLSFLCRFNLKKTWPELDEVIERIANSFLIPFESKHGFVKWLDRDSATIEEYPIDRSKAQVLNGWCFGIFGLIDYLNYRKAVSSNAFRLDEKQRLLESTLSTLKRVLPNYDTGFWSLYNLPNAEEKIANVASFHYHDLDIALLEALWYMTGDDAYKVYAERFRYYLSQLFMRLRALFVKIAFSNIIKYGYLYRR